jgi:hypothetical protein
MAIGVILSGVMAGMMTAVASVASGHTMETVLLAYMTAGLVGSLCFAAVAGRQAADVLP